LCYLFFEGTSTELLKAYVHNDPVVVEQKKGFKLPDINPTTIPSTAVDKPIMFQDKKVLRFPLPNSTFLLGQEAKE